MKKQGKEKQSKKLQNLEPRNQDNKLKDLKFMYEMAFKGWENENTLFSQRASYIVLFSTFLIFGWLTALQNDTLVALAITILGFFFNLFSILLLTRSLRAVYGYQNIVTELEKKAFEGWEPGGPINLQKKLREIKKKNIKKCYKVVLFYNNSQITTIPWNGARFIWPIRSLPALTLTAWGMQGLLMGLWSFAILHIVKILSWWHLSNSILVCIPVSITSLCFIIVLIDFWIMKNRNKETNNK